MKRWAAVLALLVFGGAAFLYWLINFAGPWYKSDATRKWRAKGEVMHVATGLISYKVEYGTYPAGSEAERLKILQGDNARRIVFVEFRPEAVGHDGRLLDPWGTPYHIEMSDAGERPRVWSSGANKTDEAGAEGSDDVASWRN